VLAVITVGVGAWYSWSSPAVSNKTVVPPK
jgi:hypothetical protein